MVCPFLHGKTGKMILYGCKGKYITEPEQEGYKVSGQTKVWQKQRIKDKVLWIEMPGELDHHSADQISREADRLVRERDNKKYGRSFQALYSYKLAFTFPTDAGLLEYLRGRVFTVEQVDFVAEYFPTGERV